MTNRTLREMYRQANKEYFDGRLPNRNVLVRFCPMDDLGRTDIIDPAEAVRITINPKLKFSKVLCMIVLIHEMAHVLVPLPDMYGDPHSKKYYLELAKAILKGIRYY